MAPTRVTAILAAAGRGARLGMRKQLHELDGKPVAAWSLATIADCALVTDVVIACEADERDAFAALARALGGGKVRAVVAGGVRRQDSVYSALRAAPTDTAIVLVHDGARPFVTADQIERVAAAAGPNGAAILAVPVKDTVKQASESGVVLRTVARETLWTAQTPQAFAYGVLMRAHEAAERDGFVGTDCAMLVEAAGETDVQIIEGSYDNIKITTPEDLTVAAQIAAQRRTAH
ncbi:MAG TPA: 2-C-methyl-D-erythritol 4-phosphate cytidylyltransferase [Candidatus Eremiobacteraceae bacterium]